MSIQNHYRAQERASERGSALVYILIAIALLAILTVSFMEPSSQQTNTQNSFKMVSELQSQIDLIRSAAQECVITYPGGDRNAVLDAGPSQKNPHYPLAPDNAYFAACVATPADGDRLVSNLRCPGNPGDNPCHARMFGGSTGKFMSQPPGLFQDWQWYNEEDGVFFWTESDKTDAFIRTALEKLAENYGACEAEAIDASGAAVPLDVAATVSCTDGSQCFRVWMVRKTPCP